MEREKIKTFAINLKHRADRRKHIIGQFERKKEFDLEIFDAIIDQNGSLGLIKSVLSIVKTASELDLDYVLICEDDHQFTEHFSSEFLLDQIHTSKGMGAEVLLGGVSWYDAAVRVKENLYWLNQFNGTQFLLIYKKLYPAILNYSFSGTDPLDIVISRISAKIFTCFPFLSQQTYFGYSDATAIHELNQINSYELFLNTENRLEKNRKIDDFYNK